MNQVYFSKGALESLLKHYGDKRKNESSKKELSGFVFTMGTDQDDNPRAFAFPHYSDNGKAGSDDDIIIQNTSLGLGCPYPPKCNGEKELIASNCYSENK